MSRLEDRMMTIQKLKENKKKKTLTEEDVGKAVDVGSVYAKLPPEKRTEFILQTPDFALTLVENEEAIIEKERAVELSKETDPKYIQREKNRKKKKELEQEKLIESGRKEGAEFEKRYMGMILQANDVIMKKLNGVQLEDIQGANISKLDLSKKEAYDELVSNLELATIQEAAFGCLTIAATLNIVEIVFALKEHLKKVKRIKNVKEFMPYFVQLKERIGIRHEFTTLHGFKKNAYPLIKQYPRLKYVTESMDWINRNCVKIRARIESDPEHEAFWQSLNEKRTNEPLVLYVGRGPSKLKYVDKAEQEADIADFMKKRKNAPVANEPPAKRVNVDVVPPAARNVPGRDIVSAPVTPAQQKRGGSSNVNPDKMEMTNPPTDDVEQDLGELTLRSKLPSTKDVLDDEDAREYVRERAFGDDKPYDPYSS